MYWIIVALMTLMVSCGKTASDSNVNAIERDGYICKDENNIVASGLIGKWTVDKDLAAKMGLTEIYIATIEFSESDAAVESFHSLLRLKEKCAYLAGQMVFETSGIQEEGVLTIKSPFMLITRSGNPTVFFDERGFDGEPGDQVRKAHPLFVMLAKGETSDKDILFIGGDNNNQPLTPFVRIK